jgi:hypothetical protein
MLVLSKKTDVPIVPESEADFSLDDRIGLVLPREPFLLVRQIAKKVTIWKSTAYRH